MCVRMDVTKTLNECLRRHEDNKQKPFESYFCPWLYKGRLTAPARRERERGRLKCPFRLVLVLRFPFLPPGELEAEGWGVFCLSLLVECWVGVVGPSQLNSRGLLGGGGGAVVWMAGRQAGGEKKMRGRMAGEGEEGVKWEVFEIER